uniref:Uncharacterized protein n=1 Tax=Solanum tuberosum TaxID=4113 RepID=M1D8Y4_SOLTU
MVKLMPWLEIGEKDDEETVKDLDVGAEKSGVQNQNLVRQNSGQRQGKAMLDDYSSGNQVLSLIPQTVLVEIGSKAYTSSSASYNTVSLFSLGGIEY